MSENEDSSEGDQPELEGDSEDVELQSKVDQVLETIQERVGGGAFGEDMITRSEFEGPIILPTDEKVVERAMESVFKERRREVAKKNNITDEKEIKRISPESVDLEIDQPVYLIHEFTNELSKIRPNLIQEIKRRETDDNTNAMTGDDDPMIPYIIKEDAADVIDVSVLGGSRVIAYNISDNLDYSKDERQFVLNANRIAAQKNGLHAHVLVDDVLFAPYKVYETPAERSRDRQG